MDLSLPAWGVWIEISTRTGIILEKRSLPAWGVWIEIINRDCKMRPIQVAPRMGSVD